MTTPGVDLRANGASDWRPNETSWKRKEWVQKNGVKSCLVPHVTVIHPFETARPLRIQFPGAILLALSISRVSRIVPRAEQVLEAKGKTSRTTNEWGQVSILFG